MGAQALDVVVMKGRGGRMSEAEVSKSERERHPSNSSRGAVVSNVVSVRIGGEGGTD